LVRDCSSFGLPQFIRIATRSARDWQQLIRALQEVLSDTPRLKSGVCV
jgi:histidinol-phosphate aminotransferase/threonine-phosphate decarboxylase